MVSIPFDGKLELFKELRTWLRFLFQRGIEEIRPPSFQQRKNVDPREVFFPLLEKGKVLLFIVRISRDRLQDLDIVEEARRYSIFYI